MLNSFSWIIDYKTTCKYKNSGQKTKLNNFSSAFQQKLFFFISDRLISEDKICLLMFFLALSLWSKQLLITLRTLWQDLLLTVRSLWRARLNQQCFFWQLTATAESKHTKKRRKSAASHGPPCDWRTKPVQGWKNEQNPATTTTHWAGTGLPKSKQSNVSVWLSISNQ